MDQKTNSFLFKLKNKSSFLSLIAICVILWSSYTAINSFAQTSSTVKVLNWWGFIEPGKMKTISKECNTAIEVTEMQSAYHFIVTFEARQPFDISVYPRDLYPDYKQAFPKPGPDISDIATNYHPAIKQRYLAQGFTSDTLYFDIASMILVYNKDHITNPNDLTLDDILKLAEQGRVVLPNSFEMIHQMLRLDSEKSTDQRWEQIYDLVINHNLQLSDFATTFYGSDFILAMHYSGEAMQPNVDWSLVEGTDNTPITPGFSLHPQYSFNAGDVLSIRSHDPATLCVARKLSSHAFAKHLTDTSFYFSPFGDIPASFRDEERHAIGKHFFESIQQTSWLPARHWVDYSPKALKIWKEIQEAQRLYSKKTQ